MIPKITHLLTFMGSAFFIILLMQFSCTKENLSDIPYSDNRMNGLSDLTKEVISMPTKESMMQSYSLLSLEEKEILWKTKLNAILENGKVMLSTKQLEIVRKIKTFLDVNGMGELFKYPETGEKFMEDNLAEMKANFSPKQIFLLTLSPYFTANFSLSKSNDYIVDGKYLGVAHQTISSTVTKVNSGMRATSAKVTISECDCLYSISCGIGNLCMDMKDKCNQVPKCGLFGASKCKGLCAQANGIPLIIPPLP